MSVHYFHCTDGRDLVVDKRGREVGPRQKVEAIARSVALDMIDAVPAFREWDGWAVHVYDTRGQVSIVPFPAEARTPLGRRTRTPARRLKVAA